VIKKFREKADRKVGHNLLPYLNRGSRCVFGTQVEKKDIMFEAQNARRKNEDS
jgi:hypothetical protein